MQALHHCLSGPAYTLSKHHVSSPGSASAKHHMTLHHMTQPEISTLVTSFLFYIMPCLFQRQNLKEAVFLPLQEKAVRLKGTYKDLEK